MRPKRGFYSWKNFNLSSTAFFSAPTLRFFLFLFSLLAVRHCAHFSSSLSYLLQIVNKSLHISFNALDLSSFFLFFLFFSDPAGAAVRLLDCLFLFHFFSSSFFPFLSFLYSAGQPSLLSSIACRSHVVGKQRPSLLFVSSSSFYVVAPFPFCSSL
jgi:hypothetical protein